MNQRTAARVAAPAAFLVGMTLAVVLVRTGLGGDEPSATTTSAVSRPATTRRATTTRTTKSRPQPVYATVERGDTLDQLALDHDTSVERLLELNPGLDPRELRIGQRVRVR